MIANGVTIRPDDGTDAVTTELNRIAEQIKDREQTKTKQIEVALEEQRKGEQRKSALIQEEQNKKAQELQLQRESITLQQQLNDKAQIQLDINTRRLLLTSKFQSDLAVAMQNTSLSPEERAKCIQTISDKYRDDMANVP